MRQLLWGTIQVPYWPIALHKFIVTFIVTHIHPLQIMWSNRPVQTSPPCGIWSLLAAKGAAPWIFGKLGHGSLWSLTMRGIGINQAAILVYLGYQGFGLWSYTSGNWTSMGIICWKSMGIDGTLLICPTIMGMSCFFRGTHNVTSNMAPSGHLRVCYGKSTSLRGLYSKWTISLHPFTLVY